MLQPLMMVQFQISKMHGIICAKNNAQKLYMIAMKYLKKKLNKN